MVEKEPFFHLSLFKPFWEGKCLLRYSRKQHAVVRYKKKKSKKPKNWHFSKGVNPWFWSKNGQFWNFFFLSNLGQENVFYDILQRKIAFLGYKINKFKNSKNWHLSQGVNPRFWSKNGCFSDFFFLGNVDQENVFYDILERKNGVLCYKNHQVQKTERFGIFPKGLTHGFCRKMASFATFSF